MVEETLANTGSRTKLLGGLQIAVGVLALLAPLQTVVAIAWIAGAVLTVVGGLMVFTAWKDKPERQGLLAGVLFTLIGIVLLFNPIIGASVLALLVAIFFFLRGLMQILAALALRPEQGWGWVLFGGALALVLGVFLLLNWPLGGMVAVGVFIGIELIFEGILLLLFGGELRTAAKSAAEEPEAPEA